MVLFVYYIGEQMKINVMWEYVSYLYLQRWHKAAVKYVRIREQVRVTVEQRQYSENFNKLESAQN